MDGHLVICIGRQFGSGGHEIGQGLSEKLGIPFYDKEILKKAAEESGILPELFEQADEKPTNSLLYSLSTGAHGHTVTFSNYNDYLTNDRLFSFQSDTIRRLAEKESCIIIGRCADFVLKDRDDVLSVFVHADEAFCLEQAMERNSMTLKEMKRFIEQTDKYRGDFYKYYTGHEWNDLRNYDLSLNSGKLGFEKCVEMIKAYLKIRF